jgi:hypothetical protein
MDLVKIQRLAKSPITEVMWVRNDMDHSFKITFNAFSEEHSINLNYETFQELSWAHGIDLESIIADRLDAEFDSIARNIFDVDYDDTRIGFKNYILDNGSMNDFEFDKSKLTIRIGQRVHKMESEQDYKNSITKLYYGMATKDKHKNHRKEVLYYFPVNSHVIS